VPSFAELLERRFADDANVRVHPFGLSDRDGVETIAEAGDASSTFTGTGKALTAEFRDVAGFFDEEHLEEVALMKINIEGGEFPLLERMLEANLMSRVRDLQIQFHSFVADAGRRRSAIRAALRRTHHLTYDYEFVWENWRRN
jgi:FkbM family methyltransferase